MCVQNALQYFSMGHLDLLYDNKNFKGLFTPKLTILVYKPLLCFKSIWLVHY